MQTSLRDRTTRGAFAAAIVIAHVLLAYFLTLGRTSMTRTSPGEGVSVMLQLPGNSNPSEIEAARPEVEPQLEEPKALDPEVLAAERTAPDAEASRAPGSTAIEVGLGRPD